MIPIITYHAVGDGPPPLWTPARMFESHLAAFAAHGLRTVTLEAAITLLRDRPTLPTDVIVITFDDGYESIYREAWPRLRAYGFGATVFLISGYCGRDNRWPSQPASVPTAPLLRWDQVSAMAEAGCEFGAHTRSHPSLPTLSPAEAEDELKGSKQEIETRIGQAVRTFAHPYGATSAGVQDMVRHYFDVAVSTELGLAHRQSDPYWLPRLDSYYLTPGMIAHLHSRSFRWYLKLRQLARSLRRRLRSDWQPRAARRATYA